MKKKAALLLVMTMACSMAACGSSAPATDSKPATEAPASEASETEAAETEAAETEAATTEAAETEATTEAAETEATTEAADTVEASGQYGEGFVFKHGFDLDYPPYTYLGDDGNYTGFDVELANAVCDYYGWEYQGVPVNWDSKDLELNANSCDCIWSGFTINGREDDYCWSIAYSDNTQMIMVPDGSDITTLADLAGKNVGVQTATSAYDLLNDEEGQAELSATFGSLQIYETYTIAFNDLKAGAIDAIAIDVTSGNFLMGNAEGYHFLEEPLGSEQYGIGFRLGDDELCQLVNEALEALVADGTYDAIGQKYPEIYDFLCLE